MNSKTLHWQKIPRIRARTLIQLIVGIAILLWLLQVANIGETFSAILQVNLFYIIGAAAFFILSSTLVALALYVPPRERNASAKVRKSSFS